MDDPEPVDENCILFRTDYVLTTDFDHMRQTKELNIYPNNSSRWTFTQVQVFLNCLADFGQPDRSRVYGDGLHAYFMLKFINKKNPNYYIRFTYRIMDVVIEVAASMKWFDEEWNMRTIEQISNIGTQKRKCLNTVKRKFYYFTKELNISGDGTYAIINQLTPLFYASSDFSEAYHGFVSFFCRCRHIPWFEDNSDISFMYDYYETWIMSDNSSKESTYEKFVSENQGYIKFIISEQADVDKGCFSIMRDDKKFSILGGIYISPFAESIFSSINENIVDGLLMDATWKTIAGYVTSILMASICNVGIPVGFTFGPSESKELYELFYTEFASVINVDLTKYIVESDGGSALAAIAADQGQFHLTCHHHYLRSLKSTEFSHQVGAITSCRCIIDLENLLEQYSTEFATYINNEEKFAQLQKSLLTCGMHFNIETKNIEICNKEQWRAISLIERANYKMPTTTNALESSHGHLNSLIPRRNNFYTSLTRLINFIVCKTQNFKKAYITNFNRAKRKIADQVTPFYHPILSKESVQYKSTRTKCECGETIILNEMMRTKLPCSHMHYKGASFPDPPEINLHLQNSFSNKTHIIIEFEERKRVLPKKTFDVNQLLNTKVATTIRKFSSCKNIKIIEKEMKQINIDEETRFASKMPLSFYAEVSNGIHQFHDYKKKRKNMIQPSDTSNCDGQCTEKQ